MTLFFFFSGQYISAYAYVLVPQFLCELGLSYYQQGRISEALHEFHKALVISPGYEPALKYIGLIQKELDLDALLWTKTREEVVSEALDSFERRGILHAAVAPITVTPAIPPAVIPPLISPLPPRVTPPIEEIITLLPEVLRLSKDTLDTLLFPLEIEQGQGLILSGKQITRFLVTQPDVIAVERISPDEVMLIAQDLGYSYLHLWDAAGRWTLDFFVTRPRPKVMTLKEILRREEERAGTFKLRYALDWSSFESGRSWDDLQRVSFHWRHRVDLTGQSPYGDIDSRVSVRTLKEATDLTYLTVGLEQGSIGPFKDFSLRAFDYSPRYLANLAFSGVNLRGVIFRSPAFDERLDYTLFWGREGGGRYGALSPGLRFTRDSFISGLNIKYYPDHWQNYNLSAFHGWGVDRPDDLYPYGYDISGAWRLFDNWRLGYELAYDTQTFAHLLNVGYHTPKLRLSGEFRETDKDFRTMTGWGWRAGELGFLSTLLYSPLPRFSISGWFDIFRDRLYPNPEDPDRWNQNLNLNLNYAIDPLTNLRMDFVFQHDPGRISPRRYHSQGLGLYRYFGQLRRFSTFMHYRRHESKYFQAPLSDHSSDRLTLGLRFGLIGNLYYYLNRELNWLRTHYSGEHTRPSAWVTGVDWRGRLFDSPFWGNLRFSYRDEEDTLSPLALLAGEDYIEGYAEISYRPKPDIEGYLSARVRNVWPENPARDKRLDANFYAGLRILWDSGLRWDSIGTIEGYVFQDSNGNGLREIGDPPLEGVKVWLGKDQFSVSDKGGRFVFKNVRAKKAYLSIDTTTIPSGFVLTVAATQEATIAHKQITRIDFGLISRTEISGFVFEDVDGDGRFGPNDRGIRGVILTLQDKTTVKTNESGRYTFTNIAPGKHTITLDLNSLPPKYIPTVPIYKNIEIFEGVTYNHNIPLRPIE